MDPNNERPIDLGLSDDDGCCGLCDGTGVADGYDHDPNWYQPGETCPCPACGGRG